MRNSIISNAKKCYICNTPYNLHIHHILYGTRNRIKSDEDGLVVYLCYNHHEGTNGVHGKNGHILDLKLKQKAEECWLKYYDKTIDDFIKRYGKNYLDLL